MAGDDQAGAVHWIDHYTIPTNDIERSIDFYERVLGMRTDTSELQRKWGRLFQYISLCRHGLFTQRTALPPKEELGLGFPRPAWSVRPEDLDAHLRRFDQFGVAHSGPLRITSEGEPGTAVYWYDPDGNQLEFWASERPPAGAFEDQNHYRIGRISHVTYVSRDLQRTAAFFLRYCGLGALPGIADDTLVLPLASGGRLIFKLNSEVGKRTSGGGLYFDLHTALVLRESEFWPTYERVWSDLPEWSFAFDDKIGRYKGDGAMLPPRTMEHASPAGQKWMAAFGRGDDWIDWDANLFHFYGGEEVNGSMTIYRGHEIADYMTDYLAVHPRGPKTQSV